MRKFSLFSLFSAVLIALFFNLNNSSFQDIPEIQISEFDFSFEDASYFPFIPERFRGISELIHHRYEIPYKIIYRLVLKESDWRHWAVSRQNYDGTRDYGLTQLNSKYFNYFKGFYDEDLVKEFYSGKFDLRNPYINLQVGFAYLKFLIDKYNGNLETALFAYNAGMGRIRTRVPESTIRYAKFILDKN